MGLNVFLVKWKKDTNPHYPGLLEAMDIAELRVVCLSPESAVEYVKKNRTGIVEIVSVEDQGPYEVEPKIKNGYCQTCGQPVGSRVPWRREVS